MNAPTAVTLERLARQQLPPDTTIEPDPTARRPFAAFNAVGTFRDAEAARGALKSSGADADQLSLLLVGGRAVRDAQGGRAVGPDPEGVTGHTTRRVVPGALVGGVVGAGAIAAGAGLLGSLNGGGLAAAAIGGGALCAAVGGMVGAFSSMDDSDAWRSTFTDLRQEVALAAVHSDDRQAAETARRQLQEAGAARTWLFDANGKAVGARGRHR